ncbi:putative receptor-like protein kinase [Canna indica]|uniref:Receptor-like protein kinase n=1 Tax=Canna indica TaxID=4628 RepID=A0AAQ3L2A9_9LILI|nr:putative receptor-like protein kinase [Canna indica]
MGLGLTLGLVAASAAAFLFSGVLISVAYKYLRANTKPSNSTNRDLEVGDKDGRGDAVAQPEVSLSPSKEVEIRQYEWQEVKGLIGELTAAAVIGEGGFSTVYLTRLPGSSLAALKVYAGGGELPRRAFRQELDVLHSLRHPRIVRLLGYSDDCEEDRGVLVLEYVPNGTLHEKLRGGGGSSLPWAARTRIAYEIAGAIEYLHDGGGSSLPIVHGDLTAANVLLDVDLSPKLCDFGSARVGFSSALRPAAPVVGSRGYADPHYLRTGIASKKTDVYSFGVLLLELLTGLAAAGPEGGVTLAAALAPRMEGTGRGVAEAVDPGMGSEYDATEAEAVAAIAAACVGEQPTMRPSMAEIRRVMREKVGSSIPAFDGKSDGQVEEKTKEENSKGAR